MDNINTNKREKEIARQEEKGKQIVRKIEIENERDI